MAAVLTLGVAGAANAADAAAAAPAEDDTVEAVVVTGSLISQRNYVAASPIVVQTAENLQQAGVVNLEQALNQLPGFMPAGSAGTGGQGTGGRATINLHGLGSNRNLVLLDGRRLPLSDINGNVDINIIPDTILSGVETITGGASAVYGSDAMSGVVNFRSINFFEGLRADFQYGNSWLGDLQKISASATLGAATGDDRGRIIVSVGYTDREGLKGNDRAFFRTVTPSSFIGQGTFVPSATNLPSQAVVTSLFNSYGVSGTVANTLNLGFNDNGTLFTQTGARNYRGPTDLSTGYAIIAGNVRMPVGQQVLIQNPMDRRSIFSKFDYDVGAGVTLYGQLMYVDSNVYTSSGGSLTQFGNLTTIPVTNPFIPADLRTLLASRPNPSAPFTWNGRYVGIPAKAWDENYKVQQYLIGARGDLPLGDWTWDLFTAFDQTRHDQDNSFAVLKDRVQNLLNAPDGGRSICAGGFNPFGLANSSNVSQACIDYMSTTAHSFEKLNQQQGQILLQGSLFELPAGPVALALLGSYRHNSYVYSPDANLASQNIEAVIASAASRGKVGVKEVAAQIDVPLLSDRPFFQQLNVGAAYRYSDYTTSGGVSAYEGDVKWRPVRDLLLRGSYQRAVRAPNIGELFQAASGAQIQFGTPPASIGDPCDIRSAGRTGAGGAQVRTLCLAQGIPSQVIDSYTFPTTATGGLSSGNPNLTPERANTYNLGLVWTSSGSGLLSNLSVSVDYYNISIKDVISAIPGLTALAKCYNLDGSNPSYSNSNQFCQLLTRDAQGQLQIIRTPFLNLGGLKTDGLEFQVNWSTPLDAIGMGGLGDRIFINSAVGHIRHYKVQTLPGTAFQDFVGTNTIDNVAGSRAFPTWKSLTTFGYERGPLTLGLRWRYQNAMRDVTAVTTPATPGPGVPAYHLFDLFGTYELSEKIQLRAGVTNLADRGPETVSSSQNSTDLSQFDPVGRSFYVGIKLAM